MVLAVFALSFTSAVFFTWCIHVQWRTQWKAEIDAVQRSSSSRAAVVQLSCNHIRGRSGSWTYNASYANASYYKDPAWIRGAETVNGPYKHSSWTWKSDSDCPITLLNLNGFCLAMQTMNLTRMFVLGDSMEFMRLVSFFHLLHMPNDVHKHLFRKMRYETLISCPSSFSIQFIFYRSNHLMPLLGDTNKTTKSNTRNGTGTHVGLSHQENQKYKKYQMEQRILAVVDPPLLQEYFTCYGVRKALFPGEDGHCPWVKEYLSYSDGRTLLMTGVGPHFHSTTYFKEMFDLFVDFLKGNPRPLDIVWFRTVTTGHENCTTEENPQAPLRSMQQYKDQYQSSPRWHDWDKFESYNQYMREQSLLFQNDSHWSGQAMDVLDVYPMTALRRDGHPTSKDCMHYLLPGPPDWWNHLLYSNLQELALQTLNHERKTKA